MDVIALRKACEGFRYSTALELKEHVSFEKLGNEVLMYIIKNTTYNGVPSTIRVIINSSRNAVKLKATSKCRCILDENGVCDKEGDIYEAPELSVVVYQCYE